jgi:hypothetical protein
MQTPKYLREQEDSWWKDDVMKRVKQSELSSMFEPFIPFVVREMNKASRACTVIAGSQAYWHTIDLASDEVEPMNWNIWVMCGGERDKALEGRALSCCRSIVRSIEQGHSPLQRRRMYVVDMPNDDAPYPSRQVGIAVDKPGRVQIDIRLMALGLKFEAKAFEKAYTTGGYLNLAGCLTFLAAINSKRLEKGYNLDALWWDIFATHLRGGGDVPRFIQNVVQDFHSVFQVDQPFFNKNRFVIGKLLIFSLKFVDGGEDALERTESRVVESLRSVLNATIASIDFQVGGGAFVVGGDALRRYVRSIAVTKDLDAKVYVPYGKHMKETVETVTAVAAKAVTMLPQVKLLLLP